MKKINEKKVLEYLRNELGTEIYNFNVRDSGLYFTINMSNSGKQLLTLTFSPIEIFGIVVRLSFTTVSLYLPIDKVPTNLFES